jgi:hypothetical protein
MRRKGCRSLRHRRSRGAATLRRRRREGLDGAVAKGGQGRLLTCIDTKKKERIRRGRKFAMAYLEGEGEQQEKVI